MSALPLARGEAIPTPRPLPSPIEGVADAAWDALVRALATAGIPDVQGDRLGMFQTRARRLGDLGFMTSLQERRDESGRKIWEGRFVPPMTRGWFLRNPVAQYRALRDSLVEYAGRIRAKALKLPEGMSLSGALGILHRGGEDALRKKKRFPETEAVYQKTKGLFQ